MVVLWSQGSRVPWPGKQSTNAIGHDEVQVSRCNAFVLRGESEAVHQQAPPDWCPPHPTVQAGKDVVEEKTRPVRIDSTDNRETLFSCEFKGKGQKHAWPRVAGVPCWFLVTQSVPLLL